MILRRGRFTLHSEPRKVTEWKDEGGEMETTLTSAAFRSSVKESERAEGRPADLMSLCSGCDLTQSFQSSSVGFVLIFPSQILR